MFAELGYNEYGGARPLFTGPEFDLLFSAISEGNSLARIWADDGSKPSAIFLWDKANSVFYITGDADDDRFNEGIAGVLAREIVPELMLLNKPYFRLRATSDVWDQRLQTIFAGVNLTRGRYIFHSHQKPFRSDWRESIPMGFRLEQIDEGFIYGSDFVNKEFVLDEILQMWPSIDRFVKFGFGFSLVTEGRIVCRCTSEFISKGMCGIGIETLQEYQGRGLATVAASAFVEHCVAMRIEPYWECNADNVASRRVAEKVGFTKELEYPVYYGKFG